MKNLILELPKQQHPQYLIIFFNLRGQLDKIKNQMALPLCRLHGFDMHFCTDSFTQTLSVICVPVVRRDRDIQE